MPQAIVTKESLINMVTSSRYNIEQVIGRALVVIFNNQTADEQSSNETNRENGIGFTGADARAGGITAKYFIKHGKLLDWQVENWTRLNVKSVPRIAKYHKQLNAAAMAKQAK